jgi:hypothetical protein
MEIPIEAVRGNMLPQINVRACDWHELFSTAIDCITEVTGVTRDEILGASRRGYIINARFMAYKMARDEFCSNNPPPHSWVSSQFAERKTGMIHHGTIIHGIQQLCNRLQTQASVYVMYCDVLRLFGERRSEYLDLPLPECTDSESHGLRAAEHRIKSIIKANQGRLDSIVKRLDEIERGKDENMVQN